MQSTYLANFTTTPLFDAYTREEKALLHCITKPSFVNRLHTAFRKRDGVYAPQPSDEEIYSQFISYSNSHFPLSREDADPARLLVYILESTPAWKEDPPSLQYRQVRTKDPRGQQAQMLPEVVDRSEPQQLDVVWLA